MPDWIASLAESLFFALAFVALYEGSRRAASQGLTRWRALLMLVGLAVPSYEGWASFGVARVAQALSVAPLAQHADEPAGGWEKASMSPAERTERSTAAAKINFLVTGRSGTFVDANGARVPFVPGTEDLAGRESMVSGEKAMEDAAREKRDRGERMLGSAAAFLVIGGVVGLLQRRRKPT